VSDLVELGLIKSPHGFRGEFILSSDSGQLSVLSLIKLAFIGTSSCDVMPFSVVSARWMPKGWLMRLAGIDSDAHVRNLVGFHVFVERHAFPELPPNEYYLSDLLGATIFDSEQQLELGKFAGLEGSGKQHWWIVKTQRGEILIPPRERYIKHVDLNARLIYLCHVNELW